MTTEQQYEKRIGCKDFYIRWFKLAFTKPFVFADGLAGLLSVTGSFFALSNPGTPLVDWAWKLPIAAFFILLLFQFMRGPYLMYKKQYEVIDRLTKQLSENKSDPLVQVRCIKKVIGKCLERCKQVRRKEWKPTSKEAFRWREEIASFLREAMITSMYADELCEPYHKVEHLERTPADVYNFFRLCTDRLSNIDEQIKRENIAEDFSVDKWEDWEPRIALQNSN